MIRKHTKTNIPGFSYGVLNEIAVLSELASDALEAARKRSDYNSQKDHEYVCDYVREQYDKVIFIFTGRGYLTGHIDIIVLVGNDLYICDFKPGEMVNSRTFITSPFDLKLSNADLKEVIKESNLSQGNSRKLSPAQKETIDIDIPDDLDDGHRYYIYAYAVK